MEKMIGIIGAMDEEVLALSAELADRQTNENQLMNFPVFTGKLNEQQVVIARCGIGKVNAALATQYLIDHFPLKTIINTGVAGGIGASVKIGHIVVSTGALHHDVDATNFGYQPGVIPGFQDSVFPADDKLVKAGLLAARRILGHGAVHSGLIVSGDQFVSSPEHKKAIAGTFPAALCVEMEGAAIAQTAVLNKIPYVIIRAISDQADNTAPEDFNAYLLKIVPTLNKVIQELVKQSTT